MQRKGTHIFVLKKQYCMLLCMLSCVRLFVTLKDCQKDWALGLSVRLGGPPGTGAVCKIVLGLWGQNNTPLPLKTSSSLLQTIAKAWKLPHCPSVEERIKMWYVCAVEYYSAMKKNERMPSAAIWMDVQTEVCQIKTNTVL